MPSPALMVSCKCKLISSSSLSATAIPPWAYCVADSVSSCLERIRTLPASAKVIAARSPATPAPTTMKSTRSGRLFIESKMVTNAARKQKSDQGRSGDRKSEHRGDRIQQGSSGPRGGVFRSPDHPITRSPDLVYDSFVNKIRVRLKQNPYDVMIARGLLRRAGRELRRFLPAPGS